MTRTLHREEVSRLIGIAMVVAAFTLAAPRWIPFFSIIENWVADLRVALFTPASPKNEEIVVLTITEETLAKFPYRSPIDRGFLAELMTTLQKAGVRAVALDILFDQPTQKEKDAALREAIRSFPAPVILAWSDATDGLKKDQMAYLRKFAEGTEKGYINLVKDSRDGVVRWIFPGRGKGRERIPGFPSAIAKALGKEVPGQDIPLAYRSSLDPDTPPFRIFPAHTARFLPKKWLTGRIVLVGPDLAVDRHRTPFSMLLSPKSREMPGVLIHAHALAQLLDGRNLARTGLALEAAIALSIGMIGILLVILDIPLALKIGATIVLLAGFWAGGAILYSFDGPLIPLFTPSLGLEITLGLGSAYTGRREREQKKFIQEAFSRFVSHDVVERLQADPSKLMLGGEKREMTFVFTDIQGFTTLSEKIDPTLLVPLLNDYLNGMSRIILGHEGTIDKFIGDAVVTFFGAPNDQPDHAQRAVRCALELDAFAQSFSAKQAERGISFGTTRIGVHTGISTVGNFGGDARFDYTAMGDTVNTASRLESVNKHLGTRICVSETAKAKNGDLNFRPIGDLVLKGKSEAVSVFEALSPERAAAGTIASYIAAYELLRIEDTGALSAFERLVENDSADGLAAYHLARLQNRERGTRITMEEK